MDPSSRQNFGESQHAAHLFNHPERPLRQQSASLGEEVPQNQERESGFFDGERSRNLFHGLFQSQRSATQGKILSRAPRFTRQQRERATNAISRHKRIAQPDIGFYLGSEKAFCAD